MFVLNVQVESMWNLIQVVFTNTTDEAIVLQLVLDSLHLITECTESIDDETLAIQKHFIRGNH